MGGKVERRRREPSRGAEGAKRMRCGEGVSPSPQGEGSEKRALPPPQKIFLDLKVKMAYFRGLCARFRFFYDHNSIEIQQ